MKNSSLIDKSLLNPNPYVGTSDLITGTTTVPFGGATTFSSSAESWPILTALQQCIKDSLRLAAYAAYEPNPKAYLEMLSARIQIEAQKEVDAWKAIMGGESESSPTGASNTGSVCKPGSIGPLGPPGRI